MPGLDGFEFLRRLSASDELRDVPTVVLTSAILDEVQRGRLGAAARIVSKSDLSSPLLLDAIKDALARRSETAT
jgi:CheY-like chemotaxis protein